MGRRIGMTSKIMYDFIVDYHREHGYAPSVRDICDGLGFESPASAHRWLQRLDAEGLIEVAPDTSRGIKIVGAVMKYPEETL